MRYDDDEDELDAEDQLRRVRIAEHLEAVIGFLAFAVLAVAGIGVYTAASGQPSWTWFVGAVLLAGVVVALWRLRRRLPRVEARRRPS
ncbi:hypothetical protein BKD30_12035 [Tersicoccus phoenicis]|uniref:Uncharacterized protein n=1 Tax=Tersicoccus phoenicis TaxID=554083 RepID=A0A1R1L7U7_9MICC|nr:hypothetical protein [Tersicoccus phoenicis]OMH23622.1 hypothetical protein BKD30_12035 [Tersicoccus phoenicis]